VQPNSPINNCWHISAIIEAQVISRIVSERLHRLDAIQLRWDRVHAAIDARAREDYDAMMKTGVVVRKKRWIGGKEGYEVEEFEIDTGAIEALNSIEKRAAIETGQEADRADINLRGGVAAQAEILRKAFTLGELEAMDAKIEAARNGGTPKQLEAVFPDIKPVPDKTHIQGRNGVAAAEAVDQANEPRVPKAPPSWRD
jgi:hypothetical protein